MESSYLFAISPVDGRYQKITKPLSPYFSEWGLFRYRIRIEIEYFIELVKIKIPQLKAVHEDRFETLRNLYLKFNLKDAEEIKDIESKTNHDVKAVEYFIKKKFEDLGLEEYKEFVHFGLTSQDINNTAVPLLLKEGFELEILPRLQELVEKLKEKATDWQEITMLARTHGQPASPTKLGKELLVFHERILKQFILLRTVPFSAKFGGATGNFNAHYAAYPDIDWHAFANQFITRLGLSRSFPTTQIEHYDNLAAFCDSIKRINTVLIDFARDTWQYISMDYFKQKIKEGEVGSSTMPHKVNPIDFENAEGNLSYANAIFEFLSSKLPISRLQRDLTDSTVLRNIGIPLAHSFIAYTYLRRGIDKLELHPEKLTEDLENNWAVISEGIQTVLRREGFPEPYETLKKLTRKNKRITRESLIEFIDNLPVKNEIREELKKLTPHSYVGK